MNITMQGTNLNLTTELRELVQQKISDSLRPLNGMNQESVKIAIELEHTTRRHVQSKKNEQLYRAEATVWLPGHTLRVEESAMDIERAIIELKHTLTRDIRKWREQVVESRRQGARKAKNIPPENNHQPTTEPLEALADEWIDEGKKLVQKEQVAEEKEWDEDRIDGRDLV